MGIDHIKLEIEANKNDYFKTWEETITFANKCREKGEHVCIIERFNDVFYVIETPDWGSDTSREKYFN
jgi:hypothetical protein